MFPRENCLCRIFPAIILLILGNLLAVAQEQRDKIAFFESKVRPLLLKHCYDCHSQEADKIKGGLLLDTREGWKAGGDSGDVIVPGNPGKSLLMETVLYSDPDLQMPPKYKLKALEIDILKKWIAMGAPDPRDGRKPVKMSSSIDIREGRKHWAFQPVTRARRAHGEERKLAER